MRRSFPVPLFAFPPFQIILFPLPTFSLSLHFFLVDFHWLLCVVTRGEALCLTFHFFYRVFLSFPLFTYFFFFHVYQFLLSYFQVTLFTLFYIVTWGGAFSLSFFSFFSCLSSLFTFIPRVENLFLGSFSYFLLPFLIVTMKYLLFLFFSF